MAKKLDAIYKSARFGNCTYALILDKRHPKKDKNTFPVVMRYTIDRKSWYNFVAGEFTEEDFAKVCNLSAKAVCSELYEKKFMTSKSSKWQRGRRIVSYLTEVFRATQIQLASSENDDL